MTNRQKSPSVIFSVRLAPDMKDAFYKVAEDFPTHRAAMEHLMKIAMGIDEEPITQSNQADINQSGFTFDEGLNITHVDGQPIDKILG